MAGIELANTLEKGSSEESAEASAEAPKAARMN
jgi:hypothetical protein